MIGGPNPSGSWHVLHHEVRIAGNEPTHIAGQQTGVGIITAPGRNRDDEFNGLASIEVADLRDGAGRNCDD
jgi:hypothetical protein